MPLGDALTEFTSHVYIYINLTTWVLYNTIDDYLLNGQMVV